ncbi:hypothetical protein V1264_013641 [Littorina saxatilis]|uniref:Uncharacterized protein n=1 Tax=Littorina saxatilis TaxID=31220 RepID=A0AAN9BTV8_9CAEN
MAMHCQSKRGLQKVKNERREGTEEARNRAEVVSLGHVPSASSAYSAAESTQKEKVRESVRRFRERLKQDPQRRELYKQKQKAYDRKYYHKRRSQDFWKWS